MNKKLLTPSLLLATLCAGPAMAVTQHALTVDTALINHERIEYWLKKRNTLASDATKRQVQAAVGAYIENYKSKLKRQSPNTTKTPTALVKTSKQRVASALKVDANTVTDVNVLALLIDFPDLKHDSNGLSASDTLMYYSNYSVGHYQNMLFSSTGFDGPSGQNLLTSKQYYQQESGGSFNFSGQVHGWYRAKNSADYYGGNDAEEEDENVPALILEAVEAAYNSGVDLTLYDQNNDGYIDHLLVFHSSIGEEAGGGNLGTNAIWSHRFSIGLAQQSTTTNPVKVNGYTIQPIDSAAGVVAHEFGHDLGLPDEYDTKNSTVGSPIGHWSVMAVGSWLGVIPGTEPNSFSPYARDFLQTKYGGKWIKQLELDAKDLSQAGQEIELVEATDHLGAINQIKVQMPLQLKQFKRPFSGQYLYYSKHVNFTTSKLSFTASLPNQAGLTLRMQAQWDIEQDYDYVQVIADGTPLSSTGITKSGFGDLEGKINIITGTSSPSDQWQKISFDLNAYAGKNVAFEIIYVTDPFVGGFGLVVDDLEINSSAGLIFSNDAESNSLTLNGFEKTDHNVLLNPQYYYLQLRSHDGLDQGLAREKYTPGVLMWLADSNFSDNNVDDHPGQGFLAVIDADQAMIGSSVASTQVRDAAFSLYQQSVHSQDNQLAPISSFDDSRDYSQPAQPQSGVIVEPWALKMAVLAQSATSTTATINLTRTIYPLEAIFSANKDGKVVQFSQASRSSTAITSYLWDFGDGSATSNLATPNHTYSELGTYQVKLTVTDVKGDTALLSKSMLITTPLVPSAQTTKELLSANFTGNVSGGVAPYSYQWDFGDQSAFGTGASVTHLFANAGIYQVEMSVTDSVEQVKVFNISLEVFAKLAPAFSHSASALQASFTNLTTGGEGAFSYLWDFGDGQSSTVQSPSHNYAAAGSYQVSLTVTDKHGTGEPVIKTVTLKAVTAVAPKSSGGGAFGVMMLISGLLLLVRRKIIAG